MISAQCCLAAAYLSHACLSWNCLFRYRCSRRRCCYLGCWCRCFSPLAVCASNWPCSYDSCCLLVGRQTVRSSTRVPRTRAAPGRLVNVARLGPPPKRGFLLAWVRDPARSCLRACLCLPLPPWLVLAAGIRSLNFHKGKRQQSTMTTDNLANCSGRTTTYSRETFYSISEITIPGSRESGARTAPASPRCATGADLSSGSVVVRVRAACPS